MHIALSGGKTLGHVMPLINIGIYLREKDIRLSYFGLHDSMEEKAALKENIFFYGLKLYPFFRKKIWKNYLTFSQIHKEKKKIIQYIKKEKVDCVIASGGFVCIPLVLAAKKCRIKIILLEQNVIMGLGNKFLSRYANHIGLTFPLKKKMNKKMEVIGNPTSLVKSSTDHPFFHRSGLKVLFTGGSNGAQVFGKVFEELQEFSESNVSYLLVTGKKYYHDFKVNHPNFYKLDFIDNLSAKFNEFDLIVSRSGSTTICEVLRAGCPLILVPSPNVTNNHQYYNAEYIVSNDAATMILEKDFTAVNIAKLIKKMLSDPQVGENMIIAQSKIDKKDIYEKIFDWIKN